jgi:hypothetical protein
MARARAPSRTLYLLGLALASACSATSQPQAPGEAYSTDRPPFEAPVLAPPQSPDAAAPPSRPAESPPGNEPLAEPDICPTLDPKSARAIEFSEPSADAKPPSPELMKRLSAAQKAQLRYLSTFCETGVRGSEQGVEVGCACCPPFEECGPVRGGRPRGNLDEVYRMVSRSEGPFTEPGVREQAVSFFGCEPHSSNSGGTVLYRRLKDAWSLSAYVSGVRPDRCQTYRLRDGRDVLICEAGDAHQSIGVQRVFVYDFAAPERRCWTDLVEFVDDSSLCEGEPGKPLTWSVLDRVRIRHLDGDRTLDLRVEGRSRSGVPVARFHEVCSAKLAREAPPTPAQLEAEHALLGPLKHLVFDFVSDGRRFKLISDPR